MRPIKLLALAALLIGGLFAVFRLSRSTFYLGGIQVNEPDHGAWIEALAASGLNTVAVTVYARQGDWDSADLCFEEEEPWVVGEAVVAKSRGLHAVLVLRVALDHGFERNKFFWHGMIMPATDAEVSEWFDRYEAFALKWARIAEDVGIDILAIGSELNTMTSTVKVDEVPALEEYWSNPEKVGRENARLLAHRQEVGERQIWVRGFEGYEAMEPFLADRAAAHADWARRVSFLESEWPIERINARRELIESRWQQLIRRVREVYSGRLTYAANFDQYAAVGFWGELDVIGINAYFPLRGRELPRGAPAARTALFAARWSAILRRIDAFRRRQGIPDRRVLFTEIGYVRRANCTIEPWAAHGYTVLSGPAGPRLMVWEDQPEDALERSLAVRGLYEANRRFRGGLLTGILYWKLSTEPAHRAVEPFVLLVGERADGDPLLAELQRFGAAPGPAACGRRGRRQPD